jgi:hypothetical protein
MAISEKNTRTLITMPKELKLLLESKAKDESRSFNNLVVKILQDYAKTLSENPGD